MLNSYRINGWSGVGKSANQPDAALHAHAQFIENFPWTPERCGAYYYIYSIYSDVRVGLGNHIQLLARDGLIPVSSGRCYTRTIAVSLGERPLSINSRLSSLLGSLLDRLLVSLSESLPERATHRKV
jgi:hypothetical protein